MTEILCFSRALLEVPLKKCSGIVGLFGNAINMKKFSPILKIYSHLKRHLIFYIVLEGNILL